MTTKGMSPLRTLAQSSPRKPQSQDSYVNENGHELDATFGSGLTLVSGRAPLCPIPLPSQLADGIGSGDSPLKGKATQAITPRGKSKLQPRADNPGCTPERQTTSGITRNRFGWHQPRFQGTQGSDKDSSSSGFGMFSPNGKLGQESPHLNEGKEIRTPSKHLRSSSFSEASHNSDNVSVLDAQLTSTSMQPSLVRAGSSNHSTPHSTRSLRLTTNDPGYTGVTQHTGTPTRNNNVSRTLKYTTGSSGYSSSGTRTGLPGLRLGVHLSQPVRSAQPHSSDYQCADVPYFELEEDPSFWNDHNVQVLIRCRPLNAAEVASQGHSRCLRQETAHTLAYIGQPEARFTFDHVACEKITQGKLFKIVGIPMVDNCMSGYNSCMFAYGQTGSGKTHTMLGDIGDLEQRPSDNRGMTPRIFEYLFGQISMEERLRKEERLKFTCKCSFLEIYNEQITDLLEPSSTNLQMREDVKKGVYVENLSEVEVESVQDVLSLLSQGAANRRVAATNMNQESSRSHSVFTCIIESQWESESMTNLRFGRLNLVDLAGSERQKSSGAEGDRLKEAANINKSLSTLGLVIMILVDVAQGKQRHVPYRDSKLTFLLQDSLGGNSKTTIIANVSPSIICASETLSTLKFAQRAKFIRNNAVVNEDASGDVLALRLQIQQLKEELNRLSRQSISRIPLSVGESRLLDLTNKDLPDGVTTVVVGHTTSLLDRVENEMPLKKVKALEAVVIGSLRREQAADNTAKRLTEEIGHLNCLVRQREDDAQFNKMMLRFREDKIKRLESIIDSKVCGEASKTEDKEALREELELMRGRLDKNPELTRFAMENIRLREQCQRLQEFYEGGERDILLDEISGLRDQLSEYLEAKLSGEGNLVQVVGNVKNVMVANPLMENVCRERSTVSEVDSLLQEKEERIQWEAYRADDLSRQLDDARNKITDLEIELRESKEAAKELADRLQLTEASLIAAQETATAAQATVKQIRLETEDIALQQRQSFSEIQEATSVWQLQELQLRLQLEEAQNMIRDLSMQKVSAALNESVENPTPPNTTEAIMQLRLELEAMECLIEEERRYRREAEEQRLSLSVQLEQSEDTCKRLTSQIEEGEVRIEKLSIELDNAEEKELATSKQLLQCSEDVKHHKMVIESLENQAVLSLNETSDLQSINAKLAQGLNKKEEELKMLTGCVVFLQSELQRELELKVLEMDNRKDNHCSTLKLKLERTRRALEQAEQLNAELQSEQHAFKALEQQKELVRADAEMETTEAITVLQSELMSLCKDHRIIQERELKSEQKVVQLQMDVNALTSKMEALSEENNHLKCLYQSTLEQKDAEITKLTLDWEMAASSLIDCLSEGNQALLDAAQEMDRDCEECVCPSSMAATGDYIAENTANVLEKRLFHAQKLAKQTEDKVRSLSEAFLAITDMERNEKMSMQSDLQTCQLLLAEKSIEINKLSEQAANWRGRAERNETNFLGACVVLNRFLDARSIVDSLKSENAHLVETLKSSQQYATRVEAELEGLSSEYSARACSVMECWLNDKIASVLETGLLHDQMCLLMEDCSVSEVRLQAVESQGRDQLTHFEEECGTIAQKITQTDVLVQELESKLQASTLYLQMSQVETIQAKEDKARLSMHLEDLMVELSCDKFAIRLEMDIIKHLLVEDFHEVRLQLMLEVMEARRMSAKLVNEKSQNIARIEALVAEIGMLKYQNMIEKEISASLNEELSQCHDQLVLLKAQREQAEVRSEHLVFHSRCIQENLSLNVFVLVLEEAILKELLVSQEAILDSDATIVKSKFYGLQRDIQEYMDKVDSLALVNASLAEEMESIMEAAQSCLVQYHVLITELKRPEEQSSVKGAEQTAGGKVKSPVTEQNLDCDVYSQEKERVFFAKQCVWPVQKALLAMQQGLKDCCNEVDILFKERNHLLNDPTLGKHFWTMMNTELEDCQCELTGMQLEYLEVDKCVQHSMELSENAGKLLAEACCIISQVKEEHGFLLEKVLHKQSEVVMLQAELQQARDELHHMQQMHSLHNENLQQLLEQERKLNDKNLAEKELSQSQLQLQLTQVCELAETIDAMYKNVSKQVHSRNLEIEKSSYQQQDLISLVSSLNLEKELLWEELNMRMNQFSNGNASCTVSSQSNNAIVSYKNIAFDADRTLFENEELRAKIERQRGDMDCLQHELTKSNNIVFEVRQDHLKTLETLHVTEELLSRLTEDFNAKCSLFCELERSHNNLQVQILEVSQENQELMNHQKKLKEELNSLEVIQGKVVKSMDAIEIREAKVLALLSDLDCSVASSLIETRDFELLPVFEECQMMLNNLETLIASDSQLAGELETRQVDANQMQVALESQALQIKAMSESIVVLEREKDLVREVKSRQEAAIKALQLHILQQETAHDVSRAMSGSSVQLLKDDEGNEMKLPGLQMRIQRTVDWLSQEIGDDFKIAFTVGCEMVLDAVETEVQTCREQAEIAWRKFDAVMDEKKALEENLIKKIDMVEKFQNEVVVQQDEEEVNKQESAEINRLNVLVREMQSKLDEKKLHVVKLEDTISHLQDSSALASTRGAELEAELSEQKEILITMRNENMHLRLQSQDLIALKEFNEVELDEKQHTIQVLEMQVQTLKSLLEQEKVFSLDRLSEDLNKALKERDLAVRERDELHADLVVLSEQLEMAQQIAEEHEAVAVEARQIAEASKTRAEQKEEEARLLEHSVEELESTVSALETQVGIVKSETERQRLMKEDTEMELQALKHQMSVVQAHQVDNEMLHHKWEKMLGELKDMQKKLLEADDKINTLEKKCDEKNEQIKKYKNDIMDIISEADRQASDHHQIIKTLENMAEQKSHVQVAVNSKPSDRCAVKPRGSGSPFKCMGSGFAHQVSFEVEEELNCNRQTIEELEALATLRQKEIFMLNVRLAEAESMTHDVIRDLVGVKLDITHYATFVGHQEGQHNLTKTVLPNDQAREKENDLAHLKARLNEFIEERESWLEEINRRQAEMMTARVAAEKLRQRDQFLSSENETLKMENVSQRNRIAVLEEEVNKLSGQQNLQQRIHHHAKIKEENNQLRLKNEDLATKLRRSEVLLTRVGEELARYREGDGRAPFIDFEEEQRLRLKLEEVDEEKIQIAHELLTLCTRVLQVAGLTTTGVVDHTVAAEALQHLQDRLDAANAEISDMKLKNMIESEKQRLSGLRSLHSPLLSSTAQPCTSPSS